MYYIESEEALKNKIIDLERKLQEGTNEINKSKRKMDELQTTEQYNEFGLNQDAQVTVKVDEAVGLPPADQNGNTDPYVSVICEGQEQKTRVINGDLNPKWDATLKFKVRKAGGTDFINFRLLHKDVSNQDELLASSIITFNKLMDQEKRDYMLSLRSANNEEIPDC